MIHVEGLTKYYHDVCAVDRISFDIQKGEILGLLGPNGAGKTTTLRMLTGFLQPTSGSIRILDYGIPEQSLEIRRTLGYLPESAPLYQDMLVLDYLSFVADLRGLRGSGKLPRIRKLAALCGLERVMHQPIGELSKGFKQRVGLAHAIMGDPQILVFDEPTSGLDPNQIVEIRKIIREIGREKTVILSTHILSEAEATCDRVIIIDKGKIAADDYTQNLKVSAGAEKRIRIELANAQWTSVQAELGSAGGVTGIQAVDPAADPLIIELTCRSPEDLRGDIYQRIKGQPWVLLEYHQEVKTLETIFRELTQER